MGHTCLRSAKALLGFVPGTGTPACGRLKSSLAPQKIRNPANSNRIAETKKTGR